MPQQVIKKAKKTQASTCVYKSYLQEVIIMDAHEPEDPYNL